jgi:hypothetical protein
MAPKIAPRAEFLRPRSPDEREDNVKGDNPSVQKLLAQLDSALKSDDAEGLNQALEGLHMLVAETPELKALGKASLPEAAEEKLHEALQQGGKGAEKMVAWVKAHPKKAAIIMAGLLVGVLPISIALAPFISATASAALVPLLGETGASIVGVGAGGALASGSRSLYVNSIPMHVLEVDPKNNKQLATDVSMSTAFGFLGFGQAEALALLAGAAAGAPVVAIIALNLIGLVGYEVAKDFVQNAIRNKVASDPKKFRDIAGSTATMETWSNGVRAFGGLGTNYVLKVMLDIFSTLAWNRIVNKHNGPNKEDPKRELANFRFDLNMKIVDLYDGIQSLKAKQRSPEEDAELEQMQALRTFYMKDLRPKAEKLWWDVA